MKDDSKSTIKVHRDKTAAAADRPFPCEVPGCGKRFTARPLLERHMNTIKHDKDVGLRPIRWVCPLHGNPFSRHDWLLVHLRKKKNAECLRYLATFLKAVGATTKEYYSKNYEGPAPETYYSATFRGKRRTTTHPRDVVWIKRLKVTDTFIVDWVAAFKAAEESMASVAQAPALLPGTAEAPVVTKEHENEAPPLVAEPVPQQTSTQADDDEYESEEDAAGLTRGDTVQQAQRPVAAEPERVDVYLRQVTMPLDAYTAKYPRAHRIDDAALRLLVVCRKASYDFRAPPTFGDLIDTRLIAGLHVVHKKTTVPPVDAFCQFSFRRDAPFVMDRDNAELFWCP